MTPILMCLQKIPFIDKNIGTKFPLRTIFIRDALEHFHCYVQPRSTRRGASVYMHHRKRSSFVLTSVTASTAWPNTLAPDRWSVLACANSTPSFASSERAVSVQHFVGRAALLALAHVLVWRAEQRTTPHLVQKLRRFHRHESVSEGSQHTGVQPGLPSRHSSLARSHR